MKKLFRFSVLLLVIGLIGLTNHGLASQAADVPTDPVVIEGPELVIWEGPPRDGPPIRITPPRQKSPDIIDGQGLDFDVRWVGSWPNDAKDAFNYAADIWSSQITSSSVTVVISATWESMGSGGPLGRGGAMYSVCFSGCPYNDTFYPYALLDKLKGSDRFGGEWDIKSAYNSDKNF